MSVLDELRRLSAAEDFFSYLGVEYEPRVVQVARLHILRRMGDYLASAPLQQADDFAARELCRAHLRAAYLDFVESTPIRERLFKVHKDAVSAPARIRTS